MRALLICPSDRLGVEALSADKSLSAWPFFGASLAVHWIEYLTARGAKQIKVVTARRDEDLRAEIGDGARWGIAAEVVAEPRELMVEEALMRHGPADQVFVADGLPGMDGQKLFADYTQFFEGVQKAFPALVRRGRVGAREIQPGVWAGLRAHIGADVTFAGPCWLGDDVHVENDAQIGPWSVLEDRVWVGAGAEVIQSIIGPETSLGAATSLKHSIASGQTLVDWQTNSITTVADSFLLCHLRATPFRQRIRRVLARLAEVAVQETEAALPAPIRVPSRLGRA